MVTPTKQISAGLHSPSNRREARQGSSEAPAKVRVIPKKTDALLQRLNKNNQSYIRAGEEELLTLNWHCVGRKSA